MVPHVPHNMVPQFSLMKRQDFLAMRLFVVLQDVLTFHMSQDRERGL